jgi:hypothetical protein
MTKQDVRRKAKSEKHAKQNKARHKKRGGKRK